MPRSQNVTSSGASQNRHVRVVAPSSTSLVIPDLPRCRPVLPKAVQEDLVPRGVHAVPEAVVLVSAQASVLRDALDRLALEEAVLVKQPFDRSQAKVGRTGEGG